MPRLIEYITRRLETKNSRFNDPLARYTRRFMNANAGRNYSIDVIDSCDMQSTKAMRRVGIRNPINAFTRSLEDYRKMQTRLRGVTKEHVKSGAKELYTRNKFARRKNVIAWHDGQQLGRFTLPDVKQFIDNQHESIGLAVNMSMRCSEYSHRSFGYDIAKYAVENGYRVEYTQLKSYNQGGGPMQPYWIEMFLEPIISRRTITQIITDN